MAEVSIRYIVHDVDAAIGFYRDTLGFTLLMHPAPTFAMLQRGALRLVLSAPGGGPGGGQVMPDGSLPEPGGWNRFAIEVSDLAATVGELQAKGVRFRNQIVTGTGGKQILAQDPSGNLVELFEPVLPEARLLQPSTAPGEPLDGTPLRSRPLSSRYARMAALGPDIAWPVVHLFQVQPDILGQAGWTWARTSCRPCSFGPPGGALESPVPTGGGAAGAAGRTKITWRFTASCPPVIRIRRLTFHDAAEFHIKWRTGPSRESQVYLAAREPFPHKHHHACRRSR